MCTGLPPFSREHDRRSEPVVDETPRDFRTSFPKSPTGCALIRHLHAKAPRGTVSIGERTGRSPGAARRRWRANGNVGTVPGLPDLPPALPCCARSHFTPAPAQPPPPSHCRSRADVAGGAGTGGGDRPHASAAGGVRSVPLPVVAESTGSRSGRPLRRPGSERRRGASRPSQPSPRSRLPTDPHRRAAEAVLRLGGKVTVDTGLVLENSAPDSTNCRRSPSRLGSVDLISSQDLTNDNLPDLAGVDYLSGVA